MNKKTQILSEQQEAITKIWNKTFISVFIANALMNLSQQMMNILVAKYADSLGATATTVGLVMSMFTYTALLLKLISAPAIDSFNRKYILMGAMIVMAIAYLGYGCSTTIPMLMTSRLLQGAGQAFTATCCLALAADALPQDKLGLGIGYFSIAQAACQAIGPTVGLSLATNLGYNTTFFIGSALMFLAALAAIRVKTEARVIKKFVISIKSIFAREAIIPAILMLLLSLAYCNINSFLVIYAGIRGVETNIGFFFTVYAVTLLFTRPIIGRLSDKYGLHKVLLPAMGFFALAFIMISFATSLPMFLFAAFVSAFGYGACQPAVQTLCMKCVPKERRGAGSCTNYIGTDLGNLAGPILAGVIAEKIGYVSMWRIMLIPIFIAMIVVYIFRNSISHAGEIFKKQCDC
ncbi:MAG: MFS transporter [Mobilitalea sp.]